MKIVKAIIPVVSAISIAVFFAGCFGGPTKAAKREYEPAPKESGVDLEERSVVSGREEVGTSPEEPQYAPVTQEDGKRVYVRVEQDDRKRVYSGFCQLRVESVEKTKNRIFSIAEQSGGYVESSYSDKITIRVPAEKFDDVFNTITGLGEVIDKTVETYDVTEAFRDLAARLEIAERTRERLYRLLEETDDVDERFRILKEIKRLTDEIESIKQNLEMISKQISLSRITVGLTARLAQQPAGKEKIPFEWIGNLDPLKVSLRHLEGSIEFELGTGFAVFEKDVAFRAESAEGTRVRVGTTRNEPSGDSSFWQKALTHYMSAYYKETQVFEFGGVRGAIFTSKDAEPFYYLAGVVTKNDTIYVIEVFFPDRNALDTRLNGIEESLRGFRAR
jgi:hypothetical protein